MFISLLIRNWPKANESDRTGTQIQLTRWLHKKNQLSRSDLSFHLYFIQLISITSLIGFATLLHWNHHRFSPYPPHTNKQTALLRYSRRFRVRLPKKKSSSKPIFTPASMGGYHPDLKSQAHVKAPTIGRPKLLASFIRFDFGFVNLNSTCAMYLMGSDE